MWKEDRLKVFVLQLKREALWLILAMGPLKHELHKKPMAQYDALPARCSPRYRGKSSQTKVVAAARAYDESQCKYLQMYQCTLWTHDTEWFVAGHSEY